jgi:hypothetical protein
MRTERRPTVVETLNPGKTSNRACQFSGYPFKFKRFPVKGQTELGLVYRDGKMLPPPYPQSESGGFRCVPGPGRVGG